MQKYVVGFLFDLSRTFVALIEKQRPDWQRGYWNGIGGKMEPWEFPLLALSREFEEETGLEIKNWDKFAVLEVGKDAIVYFFSSCVPYSKLITVETRETETVQVFSLHDLPKLLIPNLRFLIPMALHMGSDLRDETVSFFHMREHYNV